LHFAQGPLPNQVTAGSVPQAIFVAGSSVMPAEPALTLSLFCIGWNRLHYFLKLASDERVMIVQFQTDLNDIAANRR
jgi:hypothetical protein